MRLTCSAAVIGLSTATVIGTALPFSTSGGSSSVTLPSCTGASPTTSRIADAMVAGVARAERGARIGASARPPATARKRRRGALWRSMSSIGLVTQRCKECYHIFGLLGREDRLAPKCRHHVVQSVDAVVGRHDGLRIETARVDYPQPQLAHRPTRTGAREIRRQIALQLLLGKRPAVAQQAKPDAAVDHNRATARRIAGCRGQRRRNRIADDLVRLQRRGARRRAKSECHCEERSDEAIQGPPVTPWIASSPLRGSSQ